MWTDESKDYDREGSQSHGRRLRILADGRFLFQPPTLNIRISRR